MARKTQAEQEEEDARKSQKFEADDAVCPETVTGRAREVWDEIFPELRDKGFGTIIEAHALAEYCHAVANSEAAQAAIEEFGVVVITERGQRMNPAFTAKTQAAGLVEKMARGFGITPASRKGIKFETKKKENPFGKLKKSRKAR